MVGPDLDIQIIVEDLLFKTLFATIAMGLFFEISCAVPLGSMRSQNIFPLSSLRPRFVYNTAHPNKGQTLLYNRH